MLQYSITSHVSHQWKLLDIRQKKKEQNDFQSFLRTGEGEAVLSIQEQIHYRGKQFVGPG